MLITTSTVQAYRPGTDITGKALWMATCLTFALYAWPAWAAQHHAPAPDVQITEITESSHPYIPLNCARQPIQVRYIGTLAEVVMNNDARLLKQAVSASGARYVGLNDDATQLWSKGQLATLEWSGQELPLCAPPDALIPPYRASGNEPFWSVTFDGWRSTLSRPGKVDLTRDASMKDRTERGVLLAAGDEHDGWQVHARDGLCIDDMSGMPHPQVVTLRYQSQTFQGCGGDPMRLLQGLSWTVTQINGQPQKKQNRSQIEFLQHNELLGHTPCGDFRAQYSLTGESLTIEQFNASHEDCERSAMQYDAPLQTALSEVYRFSFTDSGMQTLVLHSNSGTITLTAPLLQRSQNTIP